MEQIETLLRSARSHAGSTKKFIASNTSFDHDRSLRSAGPATPAFFRLRRSNASPANSAAWKRIASSTMEACLSRELGRPMNMYFAKLQFSRELLRLSSEFPSPEFFSTPKALHSPVFTMVSRSQIGHQLAFLYLRLAYWVAEAPVSSLRIRSAVHRRNTSNRRSQTNLQRSRTPLV